MEDLDFIKDARFMSFLSPPSTEPALGFVDHVTSHIRLIEQRQRARSKKNEASFANGVGLVLGDLLQGFEDEEKGNRLSYHPKSPVHFTGEVIGADTFNHIIEMLVKLGFIRELKGKNIRDFMFNKNAPQTYSAGYATRYLPLPTLIQLATDYGLVIGQFQEAFPTQLPTKVVEVKASKKPNELQSRKMKVKATSVSKKSEELVLALNDYLDKAKLEGGYFKGFRRVFNEGDRKEFNYNLGGRLYCAGDKGYQNEKSEIRAQMTIGGENVVEVDINASYLTILHGLKSQKMPNRDDVYDIGLPRKVVKEWFTMTFGVQKFHKSWLKGQKQKLKEVCPEFEDKMTMKYVENIILQHFPIMQNWPEAGVRWSKLMFIESEIIIGTMLELMETYNAPSFPVHDSLIVRKSDQELAMRMLSEQFKDKVGIEPRLKVK